jgi:phosphoribosyl-ATP pyrophosphohydrolase
MADPTGTVLDRLFETILTRRGGDPALSYSAKLFARGRGKIAQKLGEEAVETVIAALSETPDHLVGESADLLYHLLILWAECGITPQAVWRELEKRNGQSGIDEKKLRKSKGQTA